MQLNEYQNLAINFAKYTARDYPFLALSEECGEVMGKLAKYVRKSDRACSTAVYEVKHDSNPESQKLKSDLMAELGDVLWQLSACCREIGVSLEEVAEANLDKLADRDSRNVIVSEGDNR